MPWRPSRPMLLLVGLAMVGCGAADTASSPTPVTIGNAASSPATVPSTAPPATALYVPPDPNATVGPLAPVEVIEPCPTSDPSAVGPNMLEEQTRLEPMLGQVLAYGQAHPDSWGSYGLVWQGDGDASVFVSFTTEVETHRTALLAQAAFPGELVVCQVAITGAEAQALQTQLSRELAGRFASVGVGSSGAVDVVLLPGEEQTATDLVARFGDAVVVTFGEMIQQEDAFPIST
ncbi:MAG: hypothetical protein NTZ21_18950 [Actinobacteria bacterium]|nr:hypothetical protein [Actinomycetota bacterium]